MRSWEILLSPTTPASINFFQVALYLGFVVSCYRSRHEFALPVYPTTIRKIVLYACGPLLLSAFFGILHAWAIFGVSELNRESMIQTSFNATYNLSAGLVASVLNAVLIVLASAKKTHKAEQTDAANSRASGTSGTSDAGASAPPEASGNS